MASVTLCNHTAAYHGASKPAFSLAGICIRVCIRDKCKCKCRCGIRVHCRAGKCRSRPPCTRSVRINCRNAHVCTGTVYNPAADPGAAAAVRSLWPLLHILGEHRGSYMPHSPGALEWGNARVVVLWCPIRRLGQARIRKQNNNRLPHIRPHDKTC